MGVVQGVFKELHAVRSVGAMRSNIKTLTIQDAARMMWGVLQGHKLMNEFVAHKFLGHPRLATYSLNYLFRNRLTTKQLEATIAKVEKVQRDVSALTSRLNKK